MSRIPKYTAGMFKKKMPRFGASSIRMPGMPKPPKPRVKKFAEGGDTSGYEEDPKPGVQSDKARSRKKPVKRQSDDRRVSPMEFIRAYEDSPASERMRGEASSAVRRSREGLPGDRATGFAEQRGTARSPYVDLDEKRAKEALEKMGDAALYSNAALMGREVAGKMAYDVAKAVGKANIPLRIKQLLRRRATTKINEAERAADKAGEAARRGMSRRDIPSQSEQYRAQRKAAEARASDLEGRGERALPNWRGNIDPYDRPGPGQSYMGNEVFKKGGRVKSASSTRGDGIAKRGKTRGRFV